METADKIRELREQTGMTRKDFAVHMGIPLRTMEEKAICIFCILQIQISR